jgi:hypothetical protein
LFLQGGQPVAVSLQDPVRRNDGEHFHLLIDVRPTLVKSLLCRDSPRRLRTRKNDVPSLRPGVVEIILHLACGFHRGHSDLGARLDKVSDFRELEVSERPANPHKDEHNGKTKPQLCCNFHFHFFVLPPSIQKL